MNKILLVYGGNSVEHEISIITALQIKNKYKGKYNIDLCYLYKGNFYFSKKLINISFYKNVEKNIKHIKKIYFKSNKNYFRYNFKKIHFDAVWIVSHGKNCEDGTLASYFKTMNIKVISENIYSACIGQDKVLSKKILNNFNLDFYEITEHSFSYDLEHIIKQANDIGFPLIAKPSTLGSSVGVKVVRDTNELIDAIEHLLYLSPSIIIEKNINHFEEYNIAAFRVKNKLLISEIEKVNKDKVLSYSDKYVNETKSMDSQPKELPAKISKDLKEKIETAAIEIYNKLKAQYIIRIDFIYDYKENVLYFNEINNIPGALSLYLFKAKGYDETSIIDMYIDEGLYQCEKDEKYITTYKNNIFTTDKFINVKINK